MTSISLKPSSSSKTAVIKCELRQDTIKKLQLFFEEQKFCDIVLICAKDNFRISAHRIILSAASTYFMERLKNVEIKELTFEELNGEILKLILKFIYTASIEITTETVEEIMLAARQFKLDTVEAECSNLISKSLNKSNCLSIAINSKTNDCNMLFEKALMFAAQHFVEVINDENYLQLDVEILTQLLQRNDLCVNSEEDVFRGIMLWVEHDKPNRESQCYELINHLRFPLLTPKFIVNNIGDTLQTPEFQTIIMKALKWHLSPTKNRESLFSEELCKPRNHSGKLILIKDGIELAMPVKAEIFNFITSTWICQDWPAKPQPCWYTNGILIDEKVYLGCTVVVNGVEKNCVHCFDLETKQWSELPSMIARRFSYGMIELNGELFVVGGHNGTDFLSSVEKWNPNSPEMWQQVAPMLNERMQPGLAVFNGLLYALGSTSDFDHNTFEFYDPYSNTWAELNAPEEARISVSMCVVQGLLYAVGGSTETGICTMVERYDFQSDTWSEISPSQRFQQYVQCVSWMNRLLVLVEMQEGDYKLIVEEYNPETGKWSIINSFEKHHGNAILVSNRT